MQFPLTELVRQLGFESGEEASHFAELHGLDASVEQGYVSLSRLSFAHPDTSVPVKRARNLVESQLQVSLAEVSDTVIIFQSFDYICERDLKSTGFSVFLKHDKFVMNENV